MKYQIINLLNVLNKQLKGTIVECDADKLEIADYTQIIVELLEKMDEEHDEELESLKDDISELKEDINRVYNKLRDQVDYLEQMII